MKLSLKITAYILLVLCFLVGLLLFLNVFKFQTLLTQVTTSRLSAINLVIKESLEANVNLGLSLAELSAQDILRRAQVQDPQIEELSVFDSTGRILFATDASRVGQHVAAGWAAAQAGTGEAPWDLVTERQFVSGVALVNSFGQIIGGSALVYSRAYYDQQIAAMVASLSRVSGAILAGFAAFALAGVMLLFRGLRRTLATATDALGQGAGDRAEAAPDTAGTAELQALSRAFEGRIAAAMAEIELAERRLGEARPPSAAAP